MAVFTFHFTLIAHRKKPGLDFSKSLLKWFDCHGRKWLPWRQTTDPYHIWVAEIMLQQTRVETVIPYYQKFIVRFPDIKTLASAEQEAVMTYWAGLGYYARARNLHRAAQQIRDQHNGIFPQAFEDIAALHGIGRSTAGAILAFTQNRRYPILDGNVKRVLSRFFAISGYTGTRSVETKLWEIADHLTPGHRVADYTQAIMDLGATLCTRSRPNCAKCPVGQHCLALRQGRPTAYPMPGPRAPRPQRQSRMILIRNANAEYLLIKRPPSGIWGGLWVFPEPGIKEDYRRWCEKELGIVVKPGINRQIVRHGFTHCELEIQPVECAVERICDEIMDAGHYLWYNPQSNTSIAIPAAIKKIFNQLVKPALPL